MKPTDLLERIGQAKDNGKQKMANDHRFKPFALHLNEIPTLLDAHEKDFPSTADLEAAAAKLRAMNFPPAESEHFVKAVYRRGKGHRLIPKITDAPEVISGALKEADGLAEQGKISVAVIVIVEIRGLG
jgi:hypothetical protein